MSDPVLLRISSLPGTGKDPLRLEKHLRLEIDWEALQDFAAKHGEDTVQDFVGYAVLEHLRTDLFGKRLNNEFTESGPASVDKAGSGPNNLF